MSESQDRRVDVITVQLVKNALNDVAREMQATVERTAYSHGIREVGDVSSAIFDEHGRLIAQAVAMPVQLAGSSVAIKTVLEKFKSQDMMPGDVFILNDPFEGGSHPPDLILTRPYFAEGKLVAFGTSYAHHADVGGMSPGSTPPLSTEIYQEGLLIPPMHLMHAGEINETLLAIVLANVRQGDVLTGDLRAQLAALEVGQERLVGLLERFGAETVKSATIDLLRRTELSFRRAIARIPDGVYEASEYLDDDGIKLDEPVRINVRVTVDGEQILLDFAGTAAQVAGSFNCPKGSSLSAVYAIIKVLVDPDDQIDNNEGIYAAIDVHLPPGSLLNPDRPASVSSRPETQARIANTVMSALAAGVPERAMAQDSGQMAVYRLSGRHPESGSHFYKSEVVVGGWGGRAGSDGPDAVDVCVSNLSNGPIEAIEMDFPVRIERYELREDSGGAGQFRGGLGLRREVRALGPIDLTVRAERHIIAPQGIFGGMEGLPGRWLLRRDDGTEEILRCKQAGIKLNPGDVLCAETPGGGGYGSPSERDPLAVEEDLREAKVTEGHVQLYYKGGSEGLLEG